LALVLGLIGIVVGEVLARPVAELIAGGANPVAEAATSWLRIAIIGLPGLLLVQAGNGWLRGVQDIRTPVRIVTIANVVSMIASPLLVYPAGLGLEGSAVANVVAQWLGAVLCLGALRRQRVPLRPERSVMMRQLVISRDLVIRDIAFQASFLTAAAAAGRMGAAQLAAHQIGMQLWTFLALLLDSFAIAAQSLVGAALGGDDRVAAERTAWRVTRLGLGAGVFFAVVMAAGWWLIPLAFTSDQAVLSQAHVLWPWLVAMLPFCGVVFALDGVLIGAGDNAFMRNVTLVAAVFGYIPLALCALAFGWGLGGVWAGLSAFILLRFVGMVWRVRSGRWLVLGAER
jgi:putative MATE family efflux protein